MNAFFCICVQTTTIYLNKKTYAAIQQILFLSGYELSKDICSIESDSQIFLRLEQLIIFKFKLPNIQQVVRKNIDFIFLIIQGLAFSYTSCHCRERLSSGATPEQQALLACNASFLVYRCLVYFQYVLES